MEINYANLTEDEKREIIRHFIIDEDKCDRKEDERLVDQIMRKPGAVEDFLEYAKGKKYEYRDSLFTLMAYAE